MKKIYILFFFAALLGNSVKAADTVLFDFEDGGIISGTLEPLKGTASTAIVVDNPNSSGLNTSSKVLKYTPTALSGWNSSNFTYTLSTPLTITTDTRYLHLMVQTTNLAGGSTLFLNAVDVPEDLEKGKTRFDSSISANNRWCDIVVDLNHLLTSGINLSQISFTPDLFGWGNSPNPAKDYYVDNIVLNNNPFPTGTTMITAPATIANFEDVTATNDLLTNAQQKPLYLYNMHQANDITTELNSTAYCAYVNAQDEPDRSWWHGFGFTLSSVVDAGTSPAYLHIMMKKDLKDPIVKDNDCVISLVNLSGQQSSDHSVGNTTPGVWTDFVVPIPSTHRYFNGINIKLNWIESNAGYYVDEIVINNDLTPRTKGSTSITDIAVNASIAYAEGKTIVIQGQSTFVRVFDIVGKCVFSGNSNRIPVVADGIYLVEVAGQKSKVLIK